jgi:hypothetical protein
MIDLSKDPSGLGDLARRNVVYADQAALPANRQSERVLEDYPSRSTALLRLAPGSALPADALRAGLELLVVDGEVAFDGVLLGQYGYIRHPRAPNSVVAATAHTLLFVKRGHIPPEDTTETVIQPRPTRWQAEPGTGFLTLPLHRHGAIAVALQQFPAGCAPAPRRPAGGEEILVLDGTLLDERSAYPRGSWIRNPPGSLYQPYSLEGCLIYTQSGHLPVI